MRVAVIPASPHVAPLARSELFSRSMPQEAAKAMIASVTGRLVEGLPPMIVAGLRLNATGVFGQSFRAAAMCSCIWARSADQEYPAFSTAAAPAPVFQSSRIRGSRYRVIDCWPRPTPAHCGTPSRMRLRPAWRLATQAV